LQIEVVDHLRRSRPNPINTALPDLSKTIKQIRVNIAHQPKVKLNLNFPYLTYNKNDSEELETIFGTRSFGSVHFWLKVAKYGGVG
jgi:hypothetical protein